MFRIFRKKLKRKILVKATTEKIYKALVPLYELFL